MSDAEFPTKQGECLVVNMAERRIRMAEMTKERWTAIGLELAEHLEGMRKIAKRNGIDDLCVGVYTGEDKISFAFTNAGTDEYFKPFEVSLFGNEILLEEDNHIYKRCIKP